jgi:glycerophosphoryl diester phosphodiesterase
MTHAITIELSDTLFDQLKRTAELTQRPLERLVTQSLVQTITPLIEDIPADYQRDVYPLLEMDENALRAETQRVFPAEQWAAYEALLTKKKDAPLTNAEAAQLAQLRRQADLLMLRKGYAALLLQRRGHRPTALDELPKVS